MKWRVRSLASLSGLRIWCCCGCGLAAVALIGPLAWESPYAVGATLKSQKKKKCDKIKNKRKRNKILRREGGLGGNRFCRKEKNVKKTKQNKAQQLSLLSSEKQDKRGQL